MGKRSGAVTVSLDIWHLDILEFLEMQTENGDQRRKAYDVFPQVVIPDLFMNQVLSRELWYLFDPYEVKQKLGYDLAELWGEEFTAAYYDCIKSAEFLNGLKLFKKVNALDLFKQIMKVQLESGLPYLAFKDTINRANPNKHEGYIPCTNLCTESYSNVKSGKEIHSCNLISINLATVESLTGAMDSCKIAVRMLDNTIDITTPPVKEAATHNQKYRTIGVGFMGLADYLAKRKLTYKDIEKIDFLFENVSHACLSASADLAIERGAYPAFKGSEWALGNIGNIIPKYEGESHLDHDDNAWGSWRYLRDKITRTGIRNSHVMAIAPNTSSSLVHGCTASILPVYSRFFYDKASKGSMPIAPPFIKESFWYYQENKTLDQKTVIDAVSTIQGWIDTGISMELVFNLNEGVYGEGAITAKDIFDTIFYAWSKGCKAVYYIRSVQKDNIKDECSSCAN
jgi:ribonucleoside-diphosphate reductase alpha chain